MKEDVIVAEVRRVREKLLKQYGGFDGYVKHLQEMDAARAEKSAKKPGKQVAKTSGAKAKFTRSKKN